MSMKALSFKASSTQLKIIRTTNHKYIKFSRWQFKDKEILEQSKVFDSQRHYDFNSMGYIGRLPTLCHRNFNVLKSRDEEGDQIIECSFQESIS